MFQIYSQFREHCSISVSEHCRTAVCGQHRAAVSKLCSTTVIRQNITAVSDICNAALSEHCSCAIVCLPPVFTMTWMLKRHQTSMSESNNLWPVDLNFSLLHYNEKYLFQSLKVGTFEGWGAIGAERNNLWENGQLLKRISMTLS